MTAEIVRALEQCALVLGDLPSTNQGGTRTRQAYDVARSALAGRVAADACSERDFAELVRRSRVHTAMVATLQEIAERGPNELTRDGIVTLARAALAKAVA